jgi:hypothetical protein
LRIPRYHEFHSLIGDYEIIAIRKDGNVERINLLEIDYSNFIKNNLIDKTAILRDLNNQYKVPLVFPIVCKFIPLFEESVEFYKKDSSNEMEIRVPDSLITKSIIEECYGTQIPSAKKIGLNESYYKLMIIKCRDFSRMPITHKSLKDIIVEEEYYDLLCEVTELFNIDIKDRRDWNPNFKIYNTMITNVPSNRFLHVL